MSLLSRLAVQAARAYGMLARVGAPTSLSADYLVVAGGGGGSVGNGGGGGGAGGLLTSTATLSTLNTYSITVGAGGISGYNGSNSVLSGTGLTTITSIGGGGGGSGVSGGSGGSGGGAGNGYSGGTGTSGQGNNGGTGNLSPYNIGGGGGGASVAGGNASASVSGTGGNGTASSISGSSVTYAGGGSGGSDGRSSATIGAAGTGGGGAGSISGVGTAGTANTGGGGGGGGRNGSLSPAEQNGGQGGSGIVIISYTSATPKFVGGTITTSGGKQIHTFTSSGTLSPITPITASYLVVAGGGAGGGLKNGFIVGGGGGGAGGLLTSSTTLYSGATYVVTVGAGGAGVSAGTGGSGSSSSLSGTGLTTVTSTGGGGGGWNDGASGVSGGSGGGGANNGSGGTGTSGQGNNGGGSSSAGGAGGGGGASAAGSSGSTVNGGNGGAGTASSITGTSTTYAGGGGGGGDPSQGGTSGTGGAGGGGNAGATANSFGVPGTSNLGGGGGGCGGSSTATAKAGGNGGSGIVIISYAGSQAFNGGLVTSSGGNTIHTFTSTGALTPLTNNLTNSLRFRQSASAYLNRTPTVGGDRRTWTASFWYKNGSIDSNQTLFSNATSSDSIGFRTNRVIEIYFGAGSANLVTTQVFRDVAAWYHIVVAVDTTQATAANRIKLYVNGNQVTAFSTATYPSQNYDTSFNQANIAQNIGRRASGSDLFLDGYMADINWVDGQALEPYYFGNNDANGVWKPIQYKGTYGTNGFYLTFGNTTSTTTLGYDSSPNGNNWTCNNISLTAGTTYDAMTDVPTNTSATVSNYSTWNPLQKYSGLSAPTNGNLTIAGNSANWRSILSTFAVSSGKWYCEIVMTSVSADALTGIFNINSASDLYDLTTVDNRQLGRYAGGYGYQNNGNKINNNTGTSYGSTYTTGDIVGIAFDLDNGKIWFSKNGTWQASGDPVAGTNAAYTGLSGLFAVGMSTANGTFDANFGQRAFSYTPPTGYVALNTYNLPTPTILQGNKYMDATLYTGNGAGQTVVNQAGFYPDLTWIKSRSNATNNNLFTSVLSGSNILKSNSTDGVVGVTNAITTFNSNGFTLGSDSGSIGVNINSNTYVAWQWLAGATTGTTTNTNGSITSYINVNTTAGFSQVYWTGTAANGTLGHGLGVAPKMIITKCRGSSTDWAVYHASIGNTGALRLNLTAVTETDSRYWNNTSPTSTVWSVGSSNPSNAATAMVAYVWAEIAGFSKFGSYTGNGSADGPFIYTGFRPKFMMMKRTDSTGDWYMVDSSRATYNQIGPGLNPNTTSAEFTLGSPTGGALDFLSNGFKWRGTYIDMNANGGTYIYAAFAENPFKNSNAR